MTQSVSKASFLIWGNEAGSTRLTPAPPQGQALRGVTGSRGAAAPGGSRHSDSGLRDGRVSVLPPWASVSPFVNQGAAPIFFSTRFQSFP